MAGKYRDLTGLTYATMTVQTFAYSDADRGPVWHCRCTCGKPAEMSARELRRHAKPPCGCAIRRKGKERIREPQVLAVLAEHPEWTNSQVAEQLNCNLDLVRKIRNRNGIAPSYRPDERRQTEQERLVHRLTISPHPTAQQEKILAEHIRQETARIRENWSEHTERHRSSGLTIAELKAAEYTIPELNARELIKSFSG